ncbi:hypothetical protein KR009_007143 [Drosophila setifemur]|nr:hypothetical protein KR009_007143 [Drosophila setifemur]
MQPGCWLRATQPAVGAGAGAEPLSAAGAGSGEFVEPSASVATLASISSIASTSAAALKAHPYLVPPFVTTASAPPTPQPHAASTSCMARTAPATPTRRRRRPHEEDPQMVQQADFDVADLDEMVEGGPTHAKTKSQRFFWRKALRRVFQRRK